MKKYGSEVILQTMEELLDELASTLKKYNDVHDLAGENVRFQLINIKYKFKLGAKYLIIEWFA